MSQLYFLEKIIMSYCVKIICKFIKNTISINLSWYKNTYTYKYIYIILCMLNVISIQVALGEEDPKFLGGINLSSGGFGWDLSPRQYGYQYIYASPSSVDYYRSKGVRIFRIPFAWESMQPNLFSDLSSAELSHLDDLVYYITSKRLFAIVEVQNFGRYAGGVLGSDVPIDALGDLWKKLAQHYKANPHILFDIMNEPYDMPMQTVVDMTQEAINKIRSTGSENFILAEGNGWSSALNWISNGNGALANLQDPVGNLILAPHQYLDSDGSGTSTTCVSESVGVGRIRDITDWARSHQIRLFLGEFAGGANAVCEAAVTSMLTYIRQNSDVWVGWTWWAGGPWLGSYYYSVEPESGVEKPQMGWLVPFLTSEDF